MSKDSLDDLFAEARKSVPPVPEGLAARVSADAVALQVAAERAAAERVGRDGAFDRERRRGLFGWFRAGLGGSAALAGMVAATVAGFSIGFAAPVVPGLVVSDLVAPALGLGGAEIDMMPGIDALLQEVP
ncbi:MAG: hypothetical protein FJX28_10020 [Alphaproteobacteria bacterium]|nr:hypothetical protein [Alphaproteobacteria bacterium]